MNLDGDTIAPTGNAVFATAPLTNQNQQLCTAAIPGSITINFSGTDHFTAGETLNVHYYPDVPGVVVTTTSSTVVPTPWDGSQGSATSFQIAFTTQINNTVADGNYAVGVEVDGQSYAVGKDEGSGRPQYQVKVTCGYSVANEGGAVTPILTTTPSDGVSGDKSPFPLASAISDHAALTTSNNTTPTGNVNYELFSGSNCADQAGTQVGSDELKSLSSGAADSTATDPLHAGSYYYLVTYTSTDTSKWNSILTPDCEAFTIAKGDLDLSTTPYANAADSQKTFSLGDSVHDSASVSGAVSGFAPSGTVTFTFYGSNTNGNNSNVEGDCTDPTQVAGGTAAITADTTPVDSDTTIGPLHAGAYGFTATYTNDPDYNDITTGSCEPFTVAQGTPNITTNIYLGTTELTGTTPHVDLGSVVHDLATATGIDTSSFSSSDQTAFALGAGTMAFSLYGPTTLTPPCDTSLTPADAGSGIAPVAGSYTSNDSSALHAGGYGYRASFTSSNPDYANGSGDCELLAVDKANTSTATTLYDHDGNKLGSFAVDGTKVHDTSSTTTTNASGFTIDGTTTFNFWNNGTTCSGNPSSSDPNKLVTNGNATESTEHTVYLGSSYCWKATYNGNGDYSTSTSDPEPLTVLPHGTVTDSSLCTFDTSSYSGRQFNLIYTPDTTGGGYKLNASNPGQFYYNVFSAGLKARTVTLTVPGPFVTQGAVPVHVYSGATIIGAGTTSSPMCFLPGTDITSNSQITGAPFTGSTGGTITVRIPDTPSGYAYVNVHLDYGYKGVDPCGTASNSATNGYNATGCGGTNGIIDETAYAFQVGGATTDTVYNNNVFKKDPGIGGLLNKKSDTSPIKNSLVSIYDGSNHLLGTAYTDSDGWYMWSYKYTGKAATFVIKTNGLTQNVTLKSNGFLVVNFSV